MLKILSLSVLFAAAAAAQTVAPGLPITRTISEDTIYNEGAPESTMACINLKVRTGGDSALVGGGSFDVTFVTDNSTGVTQRNAGDRDWVAPSRIQGVYNAGVNFIDSFMTSDDRVAHMRFYGSVDTVFGYTNNFAWAKAKLDTFVNGNKIPISGGGPDPGHDLWQGIYAAVLYAAAYRRPGVIPAVIAITSWSDQDAYPNPLGASEQAAVANLIRVIDSLQALGIDLRVFTISVDTHSDTTLLKNVAAAGNGIWKQTDTGTDIVLAFQEIGKKLTGVVAVGIPGQPMITEVLGPGVHYVPGSFSAVPGAGYITPAFYVDTINGLTRLNFVIDTINLGEQLDLHYCVTASIDSTTSLATRVRLFNTYKEDSLNFSGINYLNVYGLPDIKPFGQNYIWVVNGGRFLRITDKNGNAITDTLNLSADDSLLTVLGQVRDAVGRLLSTAAVVRWSIDDSTYLSVPSTVTNTGTIVKKGAPTLTQVFRIIAMVPSGTELGGGVSSGLDTLYDTLYVRVGDFRFDAIEVFTNAAAPFGTTSGDTLAAKGAAIRPGDTLILYSCDTAGVKARIHATDSTLGDSGWIYALLDWNDQGSTSQGVEYGIIRNSLKSLDSVRVSYNALSAAVYFTVKGPRLKNVTLSVAGDRIVVSLDSSNYKDTSITLSVSGLTGCGVSMDTSGFWGAGGFFRPGWTTAFQSQLGSAAADSVTLKFSSLIGGSTNISDSGYVTVRVFEPARGAWLTDTLWLVVEYRTAQDTGTIDTTDTTGTVIPELVIVPDQVYRSSPYPDGLYDIYSQLPVFSANAGDTFKLSALLFDVGRDPEKFLGNASNYTGSAQLYWYLNGVLVPVDSIFTYRRTTNGSDTLTIILGNGPNDTLAIKTIILNFGFGRERVLHLESASGMPGSPAADVDSLLYGTLKSSDTVYAVIRDEFGNFVTGDSLERWSMTPSSYSTFLSIPSATTVTSTAVITKKLIPASDMSFFLIVSLDPQAIAGVTTTFIQRDTAVIVLGNYSFDRMQIVAYSGNAAGVSGTAYAPGQPVPADDPLVLYAKEDTLVLAGEVRRNDNGVWVTQPVQWTLSNGTEMANANLPEGETVTLIPLSQIGLDTLVAVYYAGGTVYLRDTVLITVEPPLNDTAVYAVKAIVTREWVPDTASAVFGDLSNPLSAKYVLKYVFGLTDAVLAGMARDSALSLLRGYGYREYLDGYLDYADIMVEGLRVALNAACIREIYAEFDGRFFRRWEIQKLLAVPGTGAVRHFRAWLKPTFAAHPALADTLETGLSLTADFDNPAIHVVNGPNVFVGDTVSVYTPPPGVSLDSAGPVVAGFLFADNVCQTDSPSVAKIYFSEPVRTAPTITLSQVRTAFLMTFPDSSSSASLSDTVFESAVEPGEGLLPQYGGAPGTTSASAFLLSLLQGREILFKLNQTFVEFNPKAAAIQKITDLSGNTDRGRVSRREAVRGDVGIEVIACDLTAITKVDRYDALSLSWTTLPSGESVPLFPWWGLTLVNNLPYDSLPPDPIVEIRVFDLLGNLVADPGHLPALGMSIDAEKLWGNGDGTYKRTGTIDLNTLRACQTGAETNLCAAYWTGLNNKGRLVSPGGYIISRTVYNGVRKKEVFVERLVITDAGKGAGF